MISWTNYREVFQWEILIYASASSMPQRVWKCEGGCWIMPIRVKHRTTHEVWFFVYYPMLNPYMVAAFRPWPDPVCKNFTVEFAWTAAKKICASGSKGLVWIGGSLEDHAGKGWGFLCPGESGWTAVVDGIKPELWFLWFHDGLWFLYSIKSCPLGIRSLYHPMGITLWVRWRLHHF